MTWLVALLFLVAIAATVWLFTGRRNGAGEEERRRSAEDRLRAREERVERRRRLGLPDDDERGK
jgi:hypothetical protein